jgi:hypothetical protein
MAPPSFPHGPLERLDDDLWILRGEVGLKPLGRRMTVVRDESGGLFLHNAIMLDDAGFAALDALGPVRSILVPNRYHDMDGGRMKERYPDARLFALPAIVDRLRRKFPSLAPLDAAALPKGTSVRAIPGLKGDEPVMDVATSTGVTQVYTDALFNLPHAGGFSGFMLRIAGSTGGFKMTAIGKLAMLADRRAFRSFLEEQASRTDISRIVVAHGDVVERGTSAAFAGAAAAL